MQDTQKLFATVLKTLQVPRLQQKKKQVKELLQWLKKRIHQEKLQCTVVIGGSFAKGTVIGEQIDCDIFLRFHKSYAKKNLSSLTSKILKGKNKKRIHGSRDYFSIKGDNISFEIIPVLAITNPAQAVNITDASPLHVQWILKEIRKAKQKGKNLRNEIKLTKAFCKANGLYGAESYIRGFSGHVIDILCVFYGSFLNVLKASSTWKRGQVIDVSRHNKVDNKAKLQSPLIIVDPIHPERNAAASLSEDQFLRFQQKAQLFLSQPSPSFFVKQEKTLAQVKTMPNVLIIKLTLAKSKDDIAGAKIVKVMETFQKELAEFHIHDPFYLWNKGTSASIILPFKTATLPPTVVREGPPLTAKEHVQHFREKHPAAFVKDNRIYAEVKRPYTDIGKNAQALFEHPAIKERVKTIILL